MTFSERIGLPGALRADDKGPEATIEAVAAVIATRDVDDWKWTLSETDTCCSMVQELDQAFRDFFWREADGSEWVTPRPRPPCRIEGLVSALSRRVAPAAVACLPPENAQ